MKRILLPLCLVLFSVLFSKYTEKEDALKMLATAQPADYPSADEIYISNTVVNLDSNCTGSYLCEEYRKVFNENSKRNNTVRFFYDDNYGSIQVQTIEIIKADGKIISFNPAEVLKIQNNSFSGSSNIYSKTDKILSAELPNLEIGDIIYTKSIETIAKARMNGEFFSIFSVDDYNPYLSKYLSLELPKNKELYQYELNRGSNNYDFMKRPAGDRTFYEWSNQVKNIMLYEPNMDSYNFTAHHIRITTVKNWEEISRWYAGLVEPHLNIDQPIKDMVAELTKDLVTRKEKAAKLFYWVSNNIRYLGVDGETNRPGFEPHDVTYTFQTRGGVCRDKAALLCAMLREAGIGSDVSLISAGERLNMEAPVLWFNHAITASYDDNGAFEFFFDPTNENTKDFLPKYEEDNTYLIASKTGATLKTTPISKPADNNSTVDINLSLTDKDQATGLVKFSFTGFSDTIVRDWIANRNPSKIKEGFSGLLKQIHPNTKLTKLDYSDFMDKSKNIEITAQIEIADFSQKSATNIFVPFSATNLNLHFLYGYILSPLKLSQRKYAFNMPSSISFDTNLYLTLADSKYQFSIPKVEGLDHEGLKTTLKTSQNGNAIQANYHFENSRLHFKAEEFNVLKSKLSSLTQDENRYIIGRIGE